MLRKIRITLEIIFFAAITLLFLDFTGTIHAYFGWMAKIQFIPALLAVNAGIVIMLVLITFLFGRIYCSVVCPLGAFQDILSHWSNKHKRNRFVYTPAKNILRIVVLVTFIILTVAGLTSIASLIAPYSAYGRIASNLFAPIYQSGNNLLAYLSERLDSYAFYSSNYVFMKSVVTFAVALITFIIIGVLAWRNGRTYCNTICPVGTILGFFSRFSLFKVTFDTSKCNGCKLCSKNCKASCINAEEHKIDYSRCVACMDCLHNCKQGAISYVCLPGRKGTTTSKEQQDGGANKEETNSSRRTFLTIAGAMTLATMVQAQKKNVDGGLAALKNKEVPKRKTQLTPPGSWSASHFAQHCTACQLCVSNCPNQVLHPSSNLDTLMQPEMSYENGACRPECTRCSEVCPTQAIKPITREQKSSIQIGHAIYIAKNCVVNTDKVSCGNCFRHCPNGAIQMMPKSSGEEGDLMIPMIDETRCIGCGACESVCPARPFSAIYVEGHLVHKEI